MSSVPSVAHGIIISCVLMLLVTVSAIPINNGVVGEPEIECGSETITVSFKAQNPFYGKMFAKGFAHDEESCVKNGEGLEEGAFLLRFDKCGVKRSREINGVSVSATVIISFHKIFLTKVDRAYRVSCFYMEAAKSVSQELEVSMLTTRSIEKQSEMPVCRYEILRGGIDGAPVTYARIGDPVYHKWTCEAKMEDQYCMRVHTCSVDDGQGGSRVPVLDENGCEVDHFILQNLEYASDLMAGQEAHVFKFADRPALYFNCQIELRVKDGTTGCSLVQPNCVGGASPSAAPPTTVGEITASSYDSGNEFEDISTTPRSQPTEPPAPPTESPPDQSTEPAQPPGESPPELSTEPAQPPTETPFPFEENALSSFGHEQTSYRTTGAPYRTSVAGGTPTPGFPTETPWGPGGTSGAALFPQEPQDTQEPQVPREPQEQPYPPPRDQQTPPQNPYQLRWRYAQRQRRTPIQPDMVADFDLPEQQIMVFGPEDNPPPSMAIDERESLTPLNNKEGTSQTYVAKTDGSVCMSAQRFAGIAIALLGLSAVSISLVLVGFVRRHMLYEALLNKVKQ